LVGGCNDITICQASKATIDAAIERLLLREARLVRIFFGHCCFGHVLSRHFLLNPPSNHPLDGNGSRLFEHALLCEEVIEIATNVLLFSFLPLQKFEPLYCQVQLWFGSLFLLFDEPVQKDRRVAIENKYLLESPIGTGAEV
jgi:hypothetical protein